MFEWLGIPAGAIAWGFALYVLLVAPSTLASRLLVSMLVIDGIAVVSSYSNSYYLTFLGLSELNWWQVHQASDWAATLSPSIGRHGQSSGTPVRMMSVAHSPREGVRPR